jgi:PAS domain S-box-containing protein
MIDKTHTIELESLFKIFPDAVVLIDPQTKLPIRYNKAAYTLLEYEEEEFKNVSISDYEALENPDETKRHIEKILREGRDDFETRHKTKSGKILDIRVTIVLLNENQKVYFLAVFRDITQKKEKELQEKLESDAVNYILENSVGGYWDWNLVTNEEYLSPGFKKMFGYEDHEMKNTPEAWMAIIFEEDLQRVLKIFDLHVQSRGKVPFTSEVRYRHKDGSTVWVLCSGNVVEWDESGKPLRMLGSHVDITEQKNTQDLLKESEKRFSDVAEASGEYIWEIDAKGEYV